MPPKAVSLRKYLQYLLLCAADDLHHCVPSCCARRAAPWCPPWWPDLAADDSLPSLRRSFDRRGVSALRLSPRAVGAPPLSPTLFARPYVIHGLFHYAFYYSVNLFTAVVPCLVVYTVGHAKVVGGPP